LGSESPLRRTRMEAHRELRLEVHGTRLRSRLERKASAFRAEPPRAKVRGWIVRVTTAPPSCERRLPTFTGRRGTSVLAGLPWRRCQSGLRPAPQLAGVSRSHEQDPTAFRRCPARPCVSFGRCTGSTKRPRGAVGWRADRDVPSGTEPVGVESVAPRPPSRERASRQSSTPGARVLRDAGAPGAVRLFGVSS